MSFLQAVVGHEMLGERVSKANHSTAVIQSCFGRSGIGFLDEAMNARGHSQFSRPLPWCWQQKCAVKERRRLILLQDEYMSDPAEREAVNLLEFEAALLAGDPHRCVVQQPQRPQPSANAASLTQLWPRAEQPLQWHPCLTWLENHRHAQRILNYETFRTGEPAMSFLQAVFGHEMLGERVSKANHSTAVIPVLFWEVWDRIPGRSNECPRSLTIFSAIALVLAAEVRCQRAPQTHPLAG